MNFKTWIETIHDNEDSVSFGNQYATKPQKVSVIKYKTQLSEFITVNAITDSRSDKNVTKFQNFLFELDNLELEKQKALLPYLKPYVASVVYSGGKSLHFIVRLETALERLDSTFSTIKYYKLVWKEIASSLSSLVQEIVDELHFDPSCKNPSRLTRVGGARRESTNKVQEILHLGSNTAYEAFMELGAATLSELREKAEEPPPTYNFEGETETVEAFKMLAPASLLYKLQDKSWAAPENMYPELFKLTVWAIESTGVSQDCIMEYMEENTFPNLLEVGYPKEKLHVPIGDAYNFVLERKI